MDYDGPNIQQWTEFDQSRLNWTKVDQIGQNRLNWIKILW